VRKTIENSSAGIISSQHFNANVGAKASIWRTPVAAAALSLVLGLSALEAHALALGRVNVQSALGEPLRAEIEVPDINTEEAASLKATVAGPDAFKAAGLEYNPALSGIQISLQRRPDGRSFLRLSSDRPVNEPFVDLILEANWASGRIVRDYTMLFDPPNIRAQSGSPTPITSPNVSAATTQLPGSSVAPRNAPSVASNAPAKAPPTARAPAPRPAPAPKMDAAPAAAPSAAKPGSITVKAGNTATQLAARYKTQGVSLDQMLVAMLNANPDAFINGNINRLKTGAVMDIPSTETASALTPAEARQTIIAQSKDFGDFRRRLAQGAPSATAPSASRKASGTVQADVQERKPVAAAPDKLTLSKGAVAAASSASAAKGNKEEAIAKEKQAKDAAARTAELSKNIQDLSKLGGTSTVAKPSASTLPAPVASAAGVAIATGAAAPSVVAATPTTAASAPVVTPPTATAVVTPTVTTVASASTTTATTATASIDPVVTTPQATATIAKAPVPATPEPGFIDGLLGNPVTLPAAGGLLALLAGFGFYRLRQRKNATQVDSSFLESRLQPDSFFGASGGQRVDTNDAANSGQGASSSMVYSPSQLDAAGDVDPVAEADVYLAYGRDLQAEEILKEALRTNPSRIAVHAKLMEIYAKRRDIKAFETVAKEAFTVTKGHGSEWETACALGRDIDPANPLYQGQVDSSNLVTLPGAALATAGVAALAASTMAQAAQPSADDVDFDLDLDFSSGDEVTQAPQVAQNNYSSTSPIHVQSTSSINAQEPVQQPVDLEFDAPSMPEFDIPSKDAVKLSVPDMASFASGLNFSPAPAAANAIPTAPMAIAAAPAQPTMDALEFDMGDLSLDLKPTVSAQAASTAIDAGLTGDPLETKLALAQEFREIGDDDGARSLAQEVAAEATGALKARAQRMVADLS
jgi:pilus assembly protein FimV